MTPYPARDVADASRSLTPETAIGGSVRGNGFGAFHEGEADECFESLDFLAFVDNVIEQTWRSGDADFGVCVELRRRR
jgi:hypothetical protein